MVEGVFARNPADSQMQIAMLVPETSNEVAPQFRLFVYGCFSPKLRRPAELTLYETLVLPYGVLGRDSLIFEEKIDRIERRYLHGAFSGGNFEQGKSQRLMVFGSIEVLH